MFNDHSKCSERSRCEDHDLIYNKDTGCYETPGERTRRLAEYSSPLDSDQRHHFNSRFGDRSRSSYDRLNSINRNQRANPFKSYDAKIFKDSLTEEEKERLEYDKLQYGSGSADVKNDKRTQGSGANRTLKEKLSYVLHSSRRG